MAKYGPKQLFLGVIQWGVIQLVLRPIAVPAVEFLQIRSTGYLCNLYKPRYGTCTCRSTAVLVRMLVRRLLFGGFLRRG